MNGISLDCLYSLSFRRKPDAVFKWSIYGIALFCKLKIVRYSKKLCIPSGVKFSFFLCFFNILFVLSLREFKDRFS